MSCKYPDCKIPLDEHRICELIITDLYICKIVYEDKCKICHHPVSKHNSVTSYYYDFHEFKEMLFYILNNYEVISIIDCYRSGIIAKIKLDGVYCILKNEFSEMYMGQIEVEYNILSKYLNLCEGVPKIVSYDTKRNILITTPVGIPLSKIIELNINFDKNKMYRQLKTILDDIHKHKVAHRDIKTDNVIYNNDNYSFIDFGCASCNCKDWEKEVDRNDLLSILQNDTHTHL